jgi:hypothetical protein
MASFGLPRTLPGGEGRRTVIHENVENQFPAKHLPSG